jgi:predicted O-methyltransferase YrrM
MVDAQLTATSLAYAENFFEDDEVAAAARGRARELGCSAISPAGGAILRLLSHLVAAKAVVEIGTGAGVSTLYLVRGMRPDGVITTVDTEPEHQRATRQALVEAGMPSTRFRLINGTAGEVLPRLTDGAYDLVFIDADPTGYLDYLEQAVRLLRPGGVMAFAAMLAQDRIADTGRRDAETVALRELARTVRDDDRLVPVLLPIGDGLLVAATR